MSEDPQSPRGVPRTRAAFWTVVAVTAAFSAAAGALVAIHGDPAREEPAPPPEVRRGEPPAVRSRAAVRAPRPGVRTVLPPGAREADQAMRSDPIFARGGLASAWRSPFLAVRHFELFEDASEVHKNSERSARAGRLAADDAVLLRRTYERFLALFGEPLCLPRLEEGGFVLREVALWDRDVLAELDRRIHGERRDAQIEGFYDPATRLAVHLHGPEAMRAQDERPAAGGFVQKAAYQRAAEVGAEQIRHAYTTFLRGAAAADAEEDPDRPRPLWLVEGLAVFLSAVEVDAEHVDDVARAKFRHERIALEPVAFARGGGPSQPRRALAEKWTLELLLADTTVAARRRTAEVLEPGHRAEMVALHRARAWGFVHFLWHYDAGKHRLRLIEHVGRSLRAPVCAADFAALMGRPDARDWGDLAREFEWYWRQLLLRRVEADPGRRTRPESATVTDAPLGRWEPSQDDE